MGKSETNKELMDLRIDKALKHKAWILSRKLSENVKSFYLLALT